VQYPIYANWYNTSNNFLSCGIHFTFVSWQNSYGHGSSFWIGVANFAATPVGSLAK
jgi:hypothetical protein